MKKSKFLKILCSLVLCLTVGFAFMGCDVSEIKEATTAGIEASTSIIPVEYSEEIAKSTLTSAMNSSLNKVGYRTIYYGKSFIDGREEFAHEVELFSFNIDGNRFFAYEIDGGDVHVYTKIENDYYDFNMNSKTYKSENNKDYKTYALVPQKSALENVIGGKYYNGQDHVYTHLEQSGQNVYVDFVIENGLIVSINQSIYLDEFTYSVINQEFVYADGFNNLPEIPTSLEGYNPVS